VSTTPKGSKPQETELNSPACSMHAGDAVYMGYASRDEIAAFVKIWNAAQPNPTPDLVQKLRDMLPRIRDDQMHAQLKAQLDSL